MMGVDVIPWRSVHNWRRLRQQPNPLGTSMLAEDHEWAALNGSKQMIEWGNAT